MSSEAQSRRARGSKRLERSRDNGAAAREPGEAASRQSEEERYRLVFERNPQPMWVFDRETLRFLAVNNAAIERYGYTQEEFLAMTVREIRLPDDGPLVPELHDAEPEKSRPAQPARHRTKQGTVIDVELSLSDLPFAGRPGCIVTIIDVTERKRSEQARRASEERFTTIFHSAPVAIGYGTVDGQILDANQQLCEFFERRRDELIGHTVQELGLWADPRERTRVIRKLREEGVVRNYEAKFQRKSGEERTGLLSMEIISLPGESVLLAMIVDVTERKALEAQLQRANRVESLGRLASGIAHDMNNILAPIMMSGPLLRMQLPPDEIERTLTTIEASARRGADLVRQLLMFGRGVEGERGPVRAADVIREVAQMAAQTFPRNIVIHVRIAPVVWPVRGDASQLHQILLNLCVNARDAMPLGGTLTVSADNLQVDENFAAMHSEAHAGPFVRLSVSDTGTGIAPEIVDRIFDPFFTTKEVGKGTGLGLSTVLGIVKSHGGFITLHSEVGQGSTFDVHLPALPTANEDYSVVASEPVPRGQNELILVVDDEENIRTVLCETLVRHGYRVLAASDGAEATAMFARSVERIGLVITDLDMPFMDGVALIKVLKRMKPDVKAMVSTGLGSADSTSHRLPELQALGITTVLTKPYTAERILKAVHSSLASG